MKKRITLFVGLFLLSAMPASSDATPLSNAHRALKDNPMFTRFCASYLGSAVLGGGVGMITGSLIKYLENEMQQYVSNKLKMNELVTFALILLGWALESEVRNDIVIGLQGDLDEYQIDYKKVIMLRSAWIASWLSYLSA
jgi:hypothetical protein